MVVGHGKNDARARGWLKAVFPSSGLKLAQCLVGDDPGGGGKIEGAEGAVELRDGDAVFFAEGFVQPGWRAGTLVAEDQPVAGGKLCLPDSLCRLGGEEPETA